jgi:hypothetical protein
MLPFGLFPFDRFSRFKGPELTRARTSSMIESLEFHRPLRCLPGCIDRSADQPLARRAQIRARVQWKAGGTVTLKWAFGANHLGDCALFLSYDVFTARTDQKFFKIANFPECNQVHPNPNP